jgi:hypothetical protein
MASGEGEHAQQDGVDNRQQLLAVQVLELRPHLQARANVGMDDWVSLLSMHSQKKISSWAILRVQLKPNSPA